MSARRRLGIWTEWDHGVDWNVEGLTRLVRFLIEGTASLGDAHVVVFVRRHNRQAAWDSLSRAHATAGVDWSIAVVGDSFERPGSALFDRTYGPLADEECVAELYVDVLGREADADGLVHWTTFLRDGGTPAELATKFLESEERAARLPVDDTPRFDHAAISDVHADELDGAVDGWLLLRPDFELGLSLPGRRVALLADGIPIDLPLRQPELWEDGGPAARWKESTQRVLDEVDGVITFSRHVADRHAAGTFGVPADRIATILHAPPDLAPLLSWLAADRRRTPQSRTAASRALGSISTQRRWTYLIDFPFDEIDYVAIASRDRPTKNFSVAVRAIDQLVRGEFRNIKLFTTAAMDPLDLSADLPRMLAETYLYLDVVAMSDLPPYEHASLLHGAAVTVHPSPIEGGTFPFQFAESLSVGTPCLIADGAHTSELLADHPTLAPWVFDPYDHRRLARLIVDTIEARDEVVAAQAVVDARLRERTWNDVAAEYVRFVIDGERSTTTQRTKRSRR